MNGIAIRLRREDQTSPETWTVTPALESVFGFAANANKAAKEPEVFDLTFTTLLCGLLKGHDDASKFLQAYAANGGLDRRALLGRKEVSDEQFTNLSDRLNEPIDQLTLIYTVSANNLLNNARDLQAENLQEPLDVRHLIAAYIYRPSGHDTDLKSLKVSRVDLSAAFREWVRGTYPAEADHWDTVERDTFGSVNASSAAPRPTSQSQRSAPQSNVQPNAAATASGGTAPASNAAAGTRPSSRSDRVTFDNDLVLEKIPLDQDRLGMRPEVERLASLLAARDIRPPIALGLFGRWGSGKSFFMGMLRTRIDELATADKSGVYAANPAQITFNAWHYQDTSLWATLALRIFDGLAVHLSGGQPTDVSKKRRELHTQLQSSVRMRQEAEGRRNDAVSRLTTATQKRAKAQEARARSADKLSVARLKRAWTLLSTNDSFEKDLKALSGDVAALGLDKAAEGADDLARMQTQLRAFENKGQAVLGAAAASFRDASATGWSLLWIAFVLFAVAVLDYVPLIRTSSATLLQVIAAGGTAMTWITRRLEQFSNATRRADQLQKRVANAWSTAKASHEEAALASQIQALDTAIQRANDEIAAAEERAAEAEAEIQRINAGGLVYDFLTERRQSNQYLTHLGLISTIRQDFEKLRDLLDDLKTYGTRPIDRIILYVDDLDRCAPDKVVEVLQAIHLLLAFDLFNVVVGVDARWLERSLNESYAPKAAGGQVPIALPFRAQNYLEKIFQISYSLDAMNDQTFAKLIGELVPTRSEIDADQNENKKKTPLLDPGGTAQPPVNASGTDSGHTVSDQSVNADRPRTGAGGTPPKDPVIDVREAVGTLFFEDFEEQYLATLSPFIETPRLAKRLVNIYRLLRLRASQENFEAFVSSASAGTYQAALLLLAINTGFPQVGRHLLAQLASLPENAQGSLAEYVRKLVSAQAALPKVTAGERAEFEFVRDRIVAGKDGMAGGLAPYVHWAARVGRYSFDWQAAPPETIQRSA